MRQIHNAKITIFLKPEEYQTNPQLVPKIKDLFKKLLPLDFTKEKLAVQEEIVESFENRKIKIFTLEIMKEAHTKVFISTLKDLLKSEQCKTLVTQKESRLDEELCFYIRLNKELMLKDAIELTDNGDCVHIKLHVAAFPKNRDNALNVVSKMFV